MFGFIGGLSAQFSEMEWDAPCSVNLAAMFPECYEVTVKRPAYGMNRVVNVKRALELMSAPKISGNAVIEITDKFLPVNSGKYFAEWENGKVKSVSVKDSGAETDAPDLAVDVETFTQLVTGFIDINEARHKRGVAVNGNEAALKALFPKKDMCLYNYF